MNGKRDRPEDWMIELSTSTNRNPLDVIHLLDAISDTKDLDISFRLLIAKLDTLYPILTPENNRFALPEHSQLVRKLYLLIRRYDDISKELQGYIVRINCDLDCVEQGYGDWSIIQNDYEELLLIGRDFKIWIDAIAE